jgi:hypothetical protein
VNFRALAIVASASTMFAAQGCGAPPADRARDASALRVATYHSPIGLTARVDGVLAGRVNADRTACFYFNNGLGPLTLIWPSGVSARANPLRVVDSRGQLIARVGDHVTFGGGLSPEPVGSPELGCGKAQQDWLVNFAR